MKTRIIVAHDLNRCIGVRGRLPWHIPQDLQWFKEKTKGAAVIMGRKTWNSLRVRPLPDRLNIILTGNVAERKRIENNFPDVQVANNIHHAIILANQNNLDAWIIGGGTVYKDALANKVVDEVYATEITEVYEGDIFFPAIPLGNGIGWEVGQVASLIPNARVLHYTKVTK